MAVPVLKSTICGCSLRTGSLCVAYLCSVGCICFAGYILYDYLTFKDTHYQIDVLLPIQFVLTITLLIAIYKKNPPFTFPWIGYNLILNIALILFALKYLFYVLFNFYWPSLLTAILTVAVIASMFYPILVVYSYQKEISKTYHKYTVNDVPA